MVPLGEQAAGARLASLGHMTRIVVISDDATVSPQARTYAEYRVFAVIGRHAKRVRRVRVTLEALQGHGGDERLRCAVAVDLERSATLHVRGTGPHIYAAIDRTVERLGAAMERQLEASRSS